MQLGRAAPELLCGSCEPTEIGPLSDPEDHRPAHTDERQAELCRDWRLRESLRGRDAPLLHRLLLGPAPDDLCVRRSPAAQEVAFPLLRVEQRHFARG